MPRLSQVKRTPSAFDYRWLVPTSYYELYRPWHGRVHRDIQWSCYVAGDPLVIGPEYRWRRIVNEHSHLAGTACVFIQPLSGWGRRAYGQYCQVLTQFGYEVRVSSNRLVPLELCEPVLGPCLESLFALVNP